MFVLSKNAKSIININRVESIYIGADEVSIKVNASEKSACQIGKYNNPIEADMALLLLAEALNEDEKGCIRMPSDEECKESIQRNEFRHHNINGKKTRSHGGS